MKYKLKEYVPFYIARKKNLDEYVIDFKQTITYIPQISFFDRIKERVTGHLWFSVNGENELVFVRRKDLDVFFERIGIKK